MRIRVFLTVVLLLILGVVGIYAYQYNNYSSIVAPDPGHSGREVVISLNGVDIELQDAINSGLLFNISSGGVVQNTSYAHTSDRIWIKINSTEETLQEAINNKSLCSSSLYGYYTQTSFDPGHFGDQIWVVSNSVEKTLQQAIDDRDFCNLTLSLAVKSIGSNYLTLIWNDVSNNELGFTLYNSSNNLTWSKLSDFVPNIDNNATIYSVPGVKYNTTYYFYVVENISSGNKQSKIIKAVTPLCPFGYSFTGTYCVSMGWCNGCANSRMFYYPSTGVYSCTPTNPCERIVN